MPNLPSGTIVADGECADCGKAVKVKLNKNGNAYYYCRHLNADLEPCNHHERYGKPASQALQRAYLAARDGETTHDGNPPQARPAQAAPEDEDGRDDSPRRRARSGAHDGRHDTGDVLDQFR